MPPSNDFVLALKAALDQFAPNRSGDSLRKALAMRGGDLRDEVLDPPFDPNLALQIPGARRRFDLGLTFGEQADRLTIDTVDFRLDLAHGGAVGGVAAPSSDFVTPPLLGLAARRLQRLRPGQIAPDAKFPLTYWTAGKKPTFPLAHPLRLRKSCAI